MHRLPHGHRTSFTLTALLVVPAILLSGCAAGAAGDEVRPVAKTAVPNDEVLADSVGDPVDAAIAATCAAFSALTSTLENAYQRMTDHTLSTEQYAAILGSSYYGLVTLTGNPGQRGLSDEVEELLELVGDSNAAASGTLDPRSKEFVGATEPIIRACTSNNSKVTMFSAGG
jgi:hypothetical protein